MANVTLNSPLKARAHASLTVDATAGGVGFAAANLASRPTVNDPYDPVRHISEVFCTLETAQIRYTLDGTAPTTSVGHLLEVGDTLTIQGRDNIVNFRAIRTGATSGTMMITFFRQH